MKKRIFAMLIVLIMLVGMVPMAASAECTECAGAPYVPGEIFRTHHQLCEECGNKFNSGSCVANEEGICEVCKRQVVHDCDQSAYINMGTFHREGACSVCGEGGQKKGHDYSSKKISVSDTQHAKVCACGAMKNVAAHDDKDGDGKCETCGYQHECDYTAEYVGNHKHKLVCSCGKFADDISCLDADGDKFCDSCKERLYEDVITPPHEHNFVVHTNNNGTHHTSCTCGASVDVTCSDADGNRFCDSCNYEMYPVITTPHEHDYVAHSNNDRTHNLSCSCGGLVENVTCSDNDGDRYCDSCNYELYREITTPHEHNYIPHSNNDGTHTSSCSCGLSVTISCLDNDGDGKCDSCGYQKYVHVCEGGAWTSNNDGTHSSKCSCGTVMDGPNPCYTINGKTCYMCGDNMHECTYEAGVTSNKNGTHNINCECGKFVEYICLDNDGDGKCDSCGYQKYVHVCEGGAWTSNNDGTHSSKCSCGTVMDGPHPCHTINGKTCYMCGYVMVKCDHKNMVTDVTKEPTCTEDGYQKSKCPDCGDTVEGKITSKGHDFQNGKCTACGISDPDCQHPKGVEKYTPATCTDAGSHSFWCPECNFEKMEILPALEHMKLEKIEPATCTSEGKIHVVCRRCSELLLEEILPVRDHVKLDKSYPATCTEDGREHVVCTACNTVLLDKVIPAGHEFEEDRCVNCGFVCQHPNGVEEEVAATCTSEGSHSFVCPDCKLEKKEVYPILGHAEKEKKQEPTCTQPGLYHVVCTRCNKLLVEKELPVLAHKNENGKCTVCGTPDVNYVPPKPSVPEAPSEPEDTEDSEVEENNSNWLTWDLLGFHIVGNAGK